MKVVAAIISVFLLTGCLELETTIKEHKQAISPDGKTVARACLVDSGAVGSHDQLVLLTPVDFTLDKDMELSPYRIASFTRVADEKIEFIWNSPEALTIRFEQHGRGGYISYVSEKNGVQISIIHVRSQNTSNK